MRLRKTLVAIRHQLQWRKDRARLIVAPLTVLPTWQDEIAVEGQSSEILLGNAQHRLDLAANAVESGRWCLTNWEGLIVPGKSKDAASPICRLPWDAVILDETDEMKNPSAKRTKAVLDYLAGAPHRVALSGLPNPHSLMDWFTQGRFMVGRDYAFMGHHNFWEWRDEWFHQVGHDWLPRTGTRDAITKALAPFTSTLRRKDVGFVAKQTVSKRHITLPPRIRREYDRAEHEFAVGGKETKWSLVTRLWCSELAGGRPKSMKGFDHDEKLKELWRMMSGELEGQQVVIWCRYRRECAAVRDFLRGKGVSARRIVGGTPLDKRREYIDQHRRGKLKALVLHPRVARYGLDLSHCSVAFYYSLTDELRDLLQSMARLVDIMKKKNNLYIHLIARDTVDEDRYQTIVVRGVDARSHLGDMYESMQERVKDSDMHRTFGGEE